MARYRRRAGVSQPTRGRWPLWALLSAPWRRLRRLGPTAVGTAVRTMAAAATTVAGTAAGAAAVGCTAVVGAVAAASLVVIAIGVPGLVLTPDAVGFVDEGTGRLGIRVDGVWLGRRVAGTQRGRQLDVVVGRLAGQRLFAVGEEEDRLQVVFFLGDGGARRWRGTRGFAAVSSRAVVTVAIAAPTPTLVVGGAPGAGVVRGVLVVGRRGFGRRAVGCAGICPGIDGRERVRVRIVVSRGGGVRRRRVGAWPGCAGRGRGRGGLSGDGGRGQRVGLAGVLVPIDIAQVLDAREDVLADSAADQAAPQLELIRDDLEAGLALRTSGCERHVAILPSGRW